MPTADLEPSKGSTLALAARAACVSRGVGSGLQEMWPAAPAMLGAWGAGPEAPARAQGAQEAPARQVQMLRKRPRGRSAARCAQG